MLRSGACPREIGLNVAVMMIAYDVLKAAMRPRPAFRVLAVPLSYGYKAIPRCGVLKVFPYGA